MSKTHKKPWWNPIAHFAAHGFVGTVIFFIIMVPAVLLNHLVHYLADFGISKFTLDILTLLEQALVLADASLFFIFICIGAYRAIREFAEE
ncbi:MULTISPECIES: hypothetical protein [Pseudomonas]|uniref:Uncharacterized protein n=1 Tax=Pseudomonas putida TaxID=303 RepID=A0A6B7Q3J8_PSEPU|nr:MULTISPECIES: hypothetical protein [Pseudomonas]QFX76693.1 hypothetical protein [Pseudomonas putida]